MELNESFLEELFKTFLINDKILNISLKHLKYHYFPNESYKKIFKNISSIYSLSGITPSIGTLSQTFSHDSEVLSVLQRIKKANLQGTTELLLKTLEEFIRRAHFQSIYERVGEMYNEGKREAAIDLMYKESEKIKKFNLHDNMHSAVFKDFESRQLKRKNKSIDGKLNEKCVFGITQLDADTLGGGNIGTSCLWIARSGGGKSLVLKWAGMSNAKRGKRVVHFQAEGTEEECFDNFDAIWTGAKVHDIEFGKINEDFGDRIKAIHHKQLAEGGEIYVYSSESFDAMSIESCRDRIIEIEEKYGKVDLVTFDYLEIFTVNGNYAGEAGERRRREDIANKMTNLATELKVFVMAATQAMDVQPSSYNDPNFVITRSHISEFKGVVKPFSFVFSINQTDSEYEEQQARIYYDKLRKYKGRKVIKIAQSVENGRFYNAKKTKQLYGE